VLVEMRLETKSFTTCFGMLARKKNGETGK
jgi:hypothetical protein